MENEHDKKCQENIDHLATVFLNVVKMNKPWRAEDLEHMGEFIKTSSIDPTLQKVVIQQLAEAYGDAISHLIEDTVEEEQAERTQP